jgi:Putative MetA-pathway of phenol degradation
MNTASHRLACAALAAILPAAAVAGETYVPAFSRPGIAFPTATLPAGGFALEQGLPDFERDSAGGTELRSYSASTTLRYGIVENLEIQLQGSLYNWQRTRTPFLRDSRSGAGDTGLALLWALPSSNADFSWAVSGGATFASGDDDFSAGETQYDLGLATGFTLSDTVSAGLYGAVNHLDGVNTYTFSPGLSFALGDRAGAFIEAGYSSAKGSPDQAVAGGGFTYMLTPRMQLDLSADAGLNDDTPDLTGGFGVSVYFD